MKLVLTLIIAAFIGVTSFTPRRTTAGGRKVRRRAQHDANYPTPRPPIAPTYASPIQVPPCQSLINGSGITPQSLTFDPAPGQPPRLHQVHLSCAVAANDAFVARITYNTAGRAFPNVECPLRLGQEVGYDTPEEVAAIEETAKTMAVRMLHQAAFSATRECAENGEAVNCCKYVTRADGTVVTDATACAEVSAETLGAVDAAGAAAAENPAVQTYVYNTPSVSEPGSVAAKGGAHLRRLNHQMHGKGHACVTGELRAAPTLRAKLDHLRLRDFKTGLGVGLFALANSDAPVRVLARFSGQKNFTLKDAHDGIVKGFAIKLLDVPGATLDGRVKIADLPAADQPREGQAAFANTTFRALQQGSADGAVIDLLHIAVKAADTPGGTPYNIFPAPNATAYKAGFLFGAPGPLSRDELTGTHTNPLAYTYGSAGALRAGPARAMKMHWEPCPGELAKLGPDRFTDPHNPDYHRDNLRDRLERHDFRMCGYVQLQENPCRQPIEDATVRWETAPIHAFTLTLPRQTVPLYDEWCDNTVFNPYRTLPAHVPLGSINRVRQAVYAYASMWRKIVNNGGVNDAGGAAADPYYGETREPFERPAYSPPISCPFMRRVQRQNALQQQQGLRGAKKQ